MPKIRIRTSLSTDLWAKILAFLIHFRLIGAQNFGVLFTFTIVAPSFIAVFPYVHSEMVVLLLAWNLARLLIGDNIPYDIIYYRTSL